jgi:multiple sugar transport system permease protein
MKNAAMSIEGGAMLKRKRAGGLGRLLQQLVLLLGLLFFVFPVFWLISSSFKHDVDIFSLPVKLLAFQPTVANFARVLGTTTIPRLALNSLFTAGANVLLSLLIGTLAAYGISRRQVGPVAAAVVSQGCACSTPIVAAVPPVPGRRCAAAG